ncbi:hypothetical protein MMC26_002474 [Xylographa opegraphella]|nr:hypothetical protein [Xylographa opegraphella]
MSGGKMPSFNGESTHSTTLIGSESTARTNWDLPSSSYPDMPVDARTNFLPIHQRRDQTTNHSRPIQRDVYPKRMDQHSPERTSRSKQKSEFYSDTFAYRESLPSAQDRVFRKSAIIVEIKTNVIVEDEHSFMCEFSAHVAQRFQRSLDSVVLTLNHSACLIYGGTFDPAYILTITALPLYVQATTNKRNATLMQGFLAEILKVPEHRGIIRFVPVAEDNFATGGMTITSEIESLSKAGVKETVHVGHQTGHKIDPRKHSKPTRDAVPRPRNVPHIQKHSTELPRQISSSRPSQAEDAPLQKGTEKAQKLGTRRSILQLLGR